MVNIKISKLTEIAEKNLMLSLKNFPDPKYEKILERGKLLRYFVKKIASGEGQEYKEIGRIPYITGEDIDEYGFISPTKYVDDSSILLKPGTIVMGRVGSVGKIAILDLEATCSDNIFYIIPEENKFAIYLKWFFLSRFGKYQIERITKGKSQPVINRTNLLRFRVLLPYNINKIIEEISNYEQQILSLKSQIKESKLIIDEVFSKYFELDLKQYSDLEKKNIFLVNTYDLLKSIQLRVSLKFHHPKYNFILKRLKDFKVIELRQLLKEPVKKGVQPEYNEEGDIPVVKTINIKKSGYVDLSEAEHVDDRFYNKIKERSKIIKGDILITSTGEGRGKVALYTLDESAIADSTISIVRLKENVNKKYVYYYLASLFGRIQLKILETEVKAVRSIHGEEIEKIIVIYPSLNTQNKIVKEIEKKLNEQKKVVEKIEKLKQQIDNLIEKYQASISEEEEKDVKEKDNYKNAEGFFKY